MFKDLFRKLGFDELHKMQQHLSKEYPEEIFFSNIIGNENIKKLLMRAIIAKDGVSYCLVGPPASASQYSYRKWKKD